MAKIRPAIETQTTTTRRHTLQLGAEQLRPILAAYGIKVPQTARISFHVPGGGDWSNTDIDIDAENPIYIEWTETETTN